MDSALLRLLPDLAWRTYEQGADMSVYAKRRTALRLWFDDQRRKTVCGARPIAGSLRTKPVLAPCSPAAARLLACLPACRPACPSLYPCTLIFTLFVLFVFLLWVCACLVARGAVRRSSRPGPWCTTT